MESHQINLQKYKFVLLLLLVFNLRLDTSMNDIFRVMFHPKIERVGRLDYFIMPLIVSIPLVLVVLITKSIGENLISTIISIGIVLPLMLLTAYTYFLLTFKRAADLDLAWWKILGAMILVVFLDYFMPFGIFSFILGAALLFIPGTSGANTYGTSPKKIRVFFE